MKCDLDVHTLHSGMCSIPVLRNFCRESYTDPEALYETLKRRGMDLVTVTGHDSIDAAEALRRNPDFFLSEEVTCTLPAGTQAHLGVYDLDEQQHIELQRRRDDFDSFVAYLTEQRLFYSVNHLFPAIAGKTNARGPGAFRRARTGLRGTQRSHTAVFEPQGGTFRGRDRRLRYWRQ
ncbi:MAG: PHP domain-containing protein [Bryobacteraceae bacterium]